MPAKHRSTARIVGIQRDEEPTVLAQIAEAMRNRHDGGRPFLLEMMQKLNDRPDPAPLPAPTLTEALSPRISPTKHPSLVYYVLFSDRVKIGTTTNLQNRLQAIPHDRVLAVEPGGTQIERRRHAEFAALRITGEWFRYDEPLQSHIASLSTP